MIQHDNEHGILRKTLLEVVVPPCPGEMSEVRLAISNTVDTIEWVAWQAELERFSEVACVRATLVHVSDPFAALASDEPPFDVLLTPQPGVLAALDRQGLVKPLPASADAVAATYGPAALGLGRGALGELLAVPTGATVKSIVWARADTFTEAGLGMAIPDVYDDIFSHARPFDDPCMKDAWLTFGAIAREPSYLAESTTATLERWFNDVGGLARPPALNSYLEESYPDYAYAGVTPAPARLHHQASSGSRRRPPPDRPIPMRR